MNIYLITSTSNRLIEREIKKIVENNNYVFFNMAKDSFDAFFEEIGYSFFLDETKYVVVKNLLSNIDEEKSDKLLKYLSNPNEKNIIVFIEEKVDARKKIIKTIKKNFKMIDLFVDYKNIYGIVNDYIKLNKFNYDYDLTKYLVNNFGLNIDLIFNELDKVFLFYEGENIKLGIENIKKIISTPLNSNNFKFVEVTVNKDYALAQKYLEDLKSFKVEETSLIVLLAREYRIISYVKTYLNRKLSKKEIEVNLKLQDWQVDKYYNYSLKYSDSEINSILKKLAEYDLKIKTGALNKESAIQLILFDIIL